MGGVNISCLLDTGSMVSTITETYFFKRFMPHGEKELKNCHWLQLSAANGLSIPYLGYFEVNVTVLGRTIQDCGILVVEDPPLTAFKRHKELTPGLIGMNIIDRYYKELHEDYGPELFSAPALTQAEPGWREVFLCCQQREQQPPGKSIGKVHVKSRNPVKIPPGSMVMVPVTAPKGNARRFEALLEPTAEDETHLPSGVLLSPSLLTIENGLAYVPVVNVSSTVAYLPSKAPLGELHGGVHTVSKDEPLMHFYGEDSEQCQVASIDVHPRTKESDFDKNFENMDMSNLTPAQSAEVKTLLKEYVNVFAKHDKDLGCTDLIEHHIPLLDEIPVRQRYRRIPPSQYEEVKNHIKQLVEAQVVRESCSPYASPLVLVRKKDGTLRLCVDYRLLNAKTRRDAYPLPRIDESLDALSGAQWFSTLDLASGYNQVPVAEADRHKTAFCTPFGLFEFNRMPFGLCNAPSTFQRLMERIFADQSCQSLLLYLDDVIVFSSSFEQHLQRLETVLQRLQKENLRAKLSKCCLFQKEVKYLGHVVSSEGVSTDPEKIAAVAKWRAPTNVKELKSFLGFASYYRRFVAGFSKIAAPLNDLASSLLRPPNNKKCTLTLVDHWTDACELAFQTLKGKLITAPVLAYADFSKSFIVEVDASHHGLGAVISQEHNGSVRPIAYASRSLRKTERNMENYSSMKLELVALKWAVTEKFRDYLLGQKCIVYTDNNPLSHLQTAKLGAWEQQWASQLAMFDLDIRYKPGKSNGNADALSRQYVTTTQTEQ